MFTGLITAIGTVRTAHRDREGLSLEIAVDWNDVAVGESIAVDGVCLTVTVSGSGGFSVHVIDTTLDRTRFAGYGAGQRVNLERALRVGDRLGGHLVQGHVDGVARVRSVERRVDAVVVDLEAPAAVASCSVPRGSITLDGVSLTVVDVPAPGLIRVSLVPYTLQATTLGRLVPGAEVHVEGDVIGKYVAHLLAPHHGRPATRDS